MAETPAAHSIDDRLEETRRRLLDLTRSNRLLNHRTTGRGTLRVVDEIPEQVFDVLVRQGQRMQFLAREEAPPELAAAMPADDASVDGRSPADVANGTGGTLALGLAPIGDAGPAARHEDRNLQTLLAGE